MEIVQKTLARLCLENQVAPQWDEDLAKEAIKWSHEKRKRCSRTALPFHRHWLGQSTPDQEGKEADQKEPR